MVKIPCSMMDEHRDAYYHWFMMAEKGYISRSGNYLLHVDHHDDLACGGYAWDLRNMPGTPEEALAFTNQCLGIADFTVPAIWQGLFETVHIVKNLYPVYPVSKEMVIQYTPQHGLAPAAYVPFIHAAAKEAEDPSMKFFTVRQNGLTEVPELAKAERVVLDVDLDYFCWDDSLGSAPAKRLEITREAYEEYCGDRCHPFRILPKLFFRAEETDGRFYLVYREHVEREPLPSEDLIEKRITRLFRWLKKNEVVPAAIDVCRSALSGYLPAERAEFVEKSFMEKLLDTYDISMVTF